MNNIKFTSRQFLSVSIEKLYSLLLVLKKQLFILRYKQASSKLVKYHLFKFLRKNIAQINTELNRRIRKNI